MGGTRLSGLGGQKDVVQSAAEDVLLININEGIFTDFWPCRNAQESYLGCSFMRLLALHP